MTPAFALIAGTLRRSPQAISSTSCRRASTMACQCSVRTDLLFRQATRPPKARVPRRMATCLMVRLACARSRLRCTTAAAVLTVMSMAISAYHDSAPPHPQVYVTGDKKPLYSTTFDDDGRGGYASALPFNAYGKSFRRESVHLAQPHRTRAAPHAARATHGPADSPQVDQKPTPITPIAPPAQAAVGPQLSANALDPCVDRIATCCRCIGNGS